MRLNRRRWMLTLTAAVLALAPAAVTASASARGRVPRACLHHQGQTVLQNGLVRLFRFGGQLYACAGIHGKAYRLRTGPASDTVGPEVNLAGRYVAWRELDSLHAVDNIYRLNPVTGARDLIASVQVGTTHEGHGAYVLNAHGTVVWIHTYGECISNHCFIQDTVLQSNNNGGQVLDDESNSVTSDNQQALHPPIPSGSLGLSDGGTVAYWLVNGQPHSAVIP